MDGGGSFSNPNPIRSSFGSGILKERKKERKRDGIPIPISHTHAHTRTNPSHPTLRVCLFVCPTTVSFLGFDRKKEEGPLIRHVGFRIRRRVGSGSFHGTFFGWFLPCANASTSSSVFYSFLLLVRLRKKERKKTFLLLRTKERERLMLLRM